MINSKFFTIESLGCTNFKSLESGEWDLNNSSIIMFASEAGGKTNLWYLANLCKQIPGAVISKGKTKGDAYVTVSRGDTKYKFTWQFEEGKSPKMISYVEGETKHITQARQASILESLYSPTIDIDKLINSSGQKQVEIIKQALNIDTTQEEAYYKQKFEARRDLKRDLANNPKPTEVAKAEEVSFDALLAEKKSIEDFNAEQDKKQKVIDYYLGISKKLNIAIAEPNSDGYVEYIATTKNLNKDIIKFITEKLSTLDKPLEHKTLDKVNTAIQNAQKTNSDALLYKNYLVANKAYNELKLKVDKAEEEVKEARTQLLEKMQKVDIPIEGLSFDISMSDAGVLKTELMYNGLPFTDDSVNTSKKYAICARLQMGLFKEGQLAILHLNGSYMSETTVKSIAEECNKLGMQVLVEITSRKDDEPLKVESIL